MAAAIRCSKTRPTAPLTYDRAVAASLVLGRRLARGTGPGETVGLMLPNSVGAALAFLGLQATGRVPAMLNHTAGIDGVLSACRTAGLRRVVTSRRFVELAKLDALSPSAGRRGGARLARGCARATRPRRQALRRRSRCASPARCTAGSASRRAIRRRCCSPRARKARRKAVVLSHANLLANRRQIAARVDFSPADLGCSTRCRCFTASA